MNPGSPEAHSAGCTCPTEPNENGKGAHYAGTHREQDTAHFLISENCILHGSDCWRGEPSGVAA